jgi:hypothetical protein
MYSPFRFTVLLVCAVVAGAALAFGDVVHLKEGGKIEGQVISDTETEVKIATKYGIQVIPKQNVDRVEKTPTIEEIYKEKLAGIDEEDAEAHYQLGQWCKEQGLTAQAELRFRETLRLNPGHHGARVELGYVYYGGKWVHTDEIKELIETKGYIPYNGKLLTKEEYDEMTAEEEGTEEEASEGGEEEEPAVEETKAEDPGVPWSQAYEVKSSHYAITTNVGKKIGRRYSKLMEELYSEYRKVFKGYKTSSSSKFSVWLYRNQQEFMQETGRRQDVGGFYDRQSKRVTSYRGMYGSGTTDSVLAREGCHQYLDAIMTNMNAAPAWIVEGFAVYFESVIVSESGKVKMGKLPRDRLIQLKAAIAQGKFIPVDQLIRRNRNRFGPVEQAHAWSLIYFMMKGSSKYGKVLSQFFDKCAAYTTGGRTTTPGAGGRGGRGGRLQGRRTNLTAEFEQMIGDVQAFQDGWRKFISGLKVPPAGETKGDTFTSDTMGFEISKPEGWTFTSEGSEAGFQTGAVKKNSIFEVLIYANSNNQDAKTYAASLRNRLLRGYSKVDFKEGVVNGQKTAEVVYSDENKRGGRGNVGGSTGAVYKYRVVVIATGMRIYVINFKAFASVYDTDVAEFEKALQSFKLTSK